MPDFEVASGTQSSNGLSSPVAPCLVFFFTSTALSIPQVPLWVRLKIRIGRELQTIASHSPV
jgi:hypothetical protein